MPVWASTSFTKARIINYRDDSDKCVSFHCGNSAKTYLPDIEISTAPILGSTLGEENTYGALAGRTPRGPFVTFARVSTDDRNGRMASYVGEGRFTDDPLETFGLCDEFSTRCEARQVQGEVRIKRTEECRSSDLARTQQENVVPIASQPQCDGAVVHVGRMSDFYPRPRQVCARRPAVRTICRA